MAIFTNCCFCISLRNGGFILGVISIFATLFALFDEWRSVNTSKIDSNGEIVEPNWIYTALYTVMCIFTIICAFLLMYGSIKHRKNLLIPYLITHAIRCLYTVYLLQKQVFIAYNTPEDMRNMLVLGIWAIAFSLALQVYLWICVYSLYQTYREEDLRLPSAQIYQKQPAYNPHFEYVPLSRVHNNIV